MASMTGVAAPKPGLGQHQGPARGLAQAASLRHVMETNRRFGAAALREGSGEFTRACDHGQASGVTGFQKRHPNPSAPTVAMSGGAWFWQGAAGAGTSASARGTQGPSPLSASASLTEQREQ